MSHWVLGSDLSMAAQREAKMRFVHRCTAENFAARPSFAKYMRANGYSLRLLSDSEWLACTRFEVRRDGNLDNRAGYCETMHPDYPVCA